MGAFLTIALDESGTLVHVDDVAKGSRCNCVCPHCKAPLYAKNGGSVREHHFAHAQGHECDGAYESSLHMLAKEVLSEAGCIMLPENSLPGFPTGLVRLHNIEIEKRDDRYGFIPDAEGIMDNGERLLIEFYVSHKVDDSKRAIIVANNLKCIEIDVNYMALEKERLKRFLTGTDKERKWIISLPEKKVSGDESFSYSTGRNPLYLKIRDYLKEQFDKDTLIINVPNGPYASTSRQYDLRKLGYDVCEVGGRFRRFKSDLLLYRSNTRYKDKGYISLNIRGRRRTDEFRHPEDLRIIDAVVTCDNMNIEKGMQINNVNLSYLFGSSVYYHFFK